MKIPLPSISHSVDGILTKIAPLRRCGKTVVTTNGCFDLLHSGHVQYLHDAAQLGDILIVGINSDASVAHLKGPARPIQKEGDRVLIIGGLRCVDYAFIFYEHDPCAFLERIRPDIHVKGGDYTPVQLPETAIVTCYGGRVEIVPFAAGYSTTNIIDTILSH